MHGELGLGQELLADVVVAGEVPSVQSGLAAAVHRQLARAQSTSGEGNGQFGDGGIEGLDGGAQANRLDDQPVAQHVVGHGHVRGLARREWRGGAFASSADHALGELGHLGRTGGQVGHQVVRRPPRARRRRVRGRRLQGVERNAVASSMAPCWQGAAEAVWRESDSAVGCENRSRGLQRHSSTVEASGRWPARRKRPGLGAHERVAGATRHHRRGPGGLDGRARRSPPRSIPGPSARPRRRRWSDR